MFEKLYQSIHEHVTLTDQEWELCKNNFHPKQMIKGQFLLQEGDVCRQSTYIEKGALYAYAIDSAGSRRVLRFAFEGWWIGDLKSYFTNEPSVLNIEVLEDSELLIIDKTNYEKLMQEVPAFAQYHCILIENAYCALHERIENALGLTAEEKYERLIERNPEFLNRVPLHLVASYLGMSPETLSRVRGSLTNNLKQ